MDLVVVVLIGLVAVGAGAGVGVTFGGRSLRGRAVDVDAIARQRLAEAQSQRVAMVEEARAEAERMRAAAAADVQAQKSELVSEQQRLQHKEESLARKLEAIEQRDRKANQRASEIQNRLREVERLRNQRGRELERVGALTSEEARDLVLHRLDAEMREEAARQVRALLAAARLTADEEARALISCVVHRLPPERKTEGPPSVIPIPDELRRRVVGPDGRSLRALEAATGVELLTDEVPGAIVISGFDPMKRDIARLALMKMMREGRLTAQRVEELVAKATQEVEQGMMRAAKEGAAAAGITGLHPEILKVFGRLKYRTSYGQNQLMHSVEVAQVARMLAVELGADPHVASRGALLHDIGKVMGHDVDGPHHVVGADLARRHGESHKVADAIVEHHDSDPETVSVEAVIVQAADAISGARPGARHESAEQYIRRLEALEQVATSFRGVEKSFAIQAGREVRIIVKPDEIDDEGSVRLARDIAKRIEETLQYPGQVKVTVVRETRVTEIAR